jgi:hypothetical protein
MPGIRATKVPYRTEQTERSLRTGLPAGSSISAKWMKTLFGLPRIGSGRPMSPVPHQNPKNTKVFSRQCCAIVRCRSTYKVATERYPQLQTDKCED